MNQHAALLAKEQDRAALRCLEDAARGRTEKLGSPGQTLTAQACISNDVKGALAKQTARLADRDAKTCLGDPSSLPAFAYAPAASAAEAAVAESRNLAAALFGADLDVAVQLQAREPRRRALPGGGARRDAEALRRAVRARARREGRGAEGHEARPRPRSEGPGAVGPRARDRAGRAPRVGRKGQAQQARREARVDGERALRRDRGATRASLPRRVRRCRRPGRARCVRRRRRRSGLLACLRRDRRARSPVRSRRRRPRGPELRRARARRARARRARLRRRRVYARAHRDARRRGLRRRAARARHHRGDAALDAAARRVPEPRPRLPRAARPVPGNPVDGQPGRNDVPEELQRAEYLRARRDATASSRRCSSTSGSTTSTSSRRPTARCDIDALPARSRSARTCSAASASSLLAIARSPGDGRLPRRPRNEVGGINENFSRELLELHTLRRRGSLHRDRREGGGARLTGWRMNPTRPTASTSAPTCHDFGAKTVLGVALPGRRRLRGRRRADRSLARAPEHRRASSREARASASSREDPPPRCVAARRDGVPRDTAATIARDAPRRSCSRRRVPRSTPEPRRQDEAPARSSGSSLARALGADPAALNTDHIRRRDPRPRRGALPAAPPTGYPDVSGAWASPGALVQRFNVLEDAADGVAASSSASRRRRHAPTAERRRRVAAALFPARRRRAATRDAADRVPRRPRRRATRRRASSRPAAFLLASPEFLAH